jgi:hypothetical protein
MYPFFGDKLLANIHNVAMKEFVDHIADLSPATIRDYVNIAKSVVASARDEEGKMLFPRAWDDEFIDVPFIEDQNQPTVDKDGMESILREAEEPYRTLYALLAGCGPMRAGEALGLDIKSIHPDFRTLDIVQKAKRGELHDYMKTKNADSRHGRVVDLPAKLAAVLRDFGHPAQRSSVLRRGRLADFATGHSQIQPASHPEEAGTGTGWTQHLSALPNYRNGDSRSSPSTAAHLVRTCKNTRFGAL